MTKILYEEVSKDHLQRLMDMEDQFKIAYELELEAEHASAAEYLGANETILNYVYNGDKDRAYEIIYEKTIEETARRTSFLQSIPPLSDIYQDLEDKLSSVLGTSKINSRLYYLFSFMIKYGVTTKEKLIENIWYVMSFPLAQAVHPGEMLLFLKDSPQIRIKFYKMLKSFAPELLEMYELPQSIATSKDSIFIQLDNRDIRKIEDINDIISRDVMFEIIKNYIFDYESPITCYPQIKPLIGMNQFYNWFDSMDILHEMILGGGEILSSACGINGSMSIRDVFAQFDENIDAIDAIYQYDLEQALEKYQETDFMDLVVTKMEKAMLDLNNPHIPTIEFDDLVDIFWEVFPTVTKNWGGQLDIVRDGSLVFGIEVRPKLYFEGISTAFSFIEDFYKDLENQDIFRFDRTTGLHINVSMKISKPWNLFKGMILIDELGYIKDLFGIDRDSYAKFIRESFLNMIQVYISDKFKFYNEEQINTTIFRNNLNFVESYHIGEMSDFEKELSSKLKIIQEKDRNVGFNMQNISEKDKNGKQTDYMEFRYPGGNVTKDGIEKATLYFCHIVASMLYPDYEKERYLRLFSELIINALKMLKKK